MAVGKKVPVVFYPQYTTVTGTWPLFTLPIDTLGYGKVVVTYWRGQFSPPGIAPSVTFQLEQSTDMNEWSTLGSGEMPGEATPLTLSVEPTQRYLRLQALVSENVSATVYALGYAESTAD